MIHCYSTNTIHIVLFIFLHLGTARQSCSIYSGQGDSCIFPYRFNGEFYSECTTNFVKDSTTPMCPIRLQNSQTLEASKNVEDWGRCSKDCDLQEYGSNMNIYDELVELARQFPSIAKPFTIGYSTRGVELLGIRISQNVRRERKLMKPMVRLVGNMHGNEVVGREVLLHLARHLLHGYAWDKRIRQIVAETDISILPSLNPDGYEEASPGSCSRTAGMLNARGKDLDQDFPTWLDYQRFIKDEDFDPFEGGRQAETLSMMEWSVSPFVISANLHDGAVLVTYPFDHNIGKEQSKGHLTPDDDLFQHLAKTYASNHKTMANGTKCYKRARNGVSNGALWHSKNTGGALQGSLKDFSYLFTSNLEVSLELNCCKYPRSVYLLKEWENNKQSLLAYVEQVHAGIKGTVSVEGGKPQAGADIIVWNPDGKKRLKNVATSDRGEFWKILIPGPPGRNTYKVQAHFQDCGQFGSGKVYESPQYDITLPYAKPLRVKNLKMTHVGYCGGKELGGLYDVASDI